MTTRSDVVPGEHLDKPRVLIVDDDPMTCRLVKLQLEAEGYPCTTLSDPERVLEVIGAESPALLLADFHLGARDVLDLVHTIRSHPVYHNLLVIVMSGVDYQRESKLAGADGFLLKPFAPQELVGTIQEVLKRQET